MLFIFLIVNDPMLAQNSRHATTYNKLDHTVRCGLVAVWDSVVRGIYGLLLAAFSPRFTGTLWVIFEIAATFLAAFSPSASMPR